VSSLSEYLAVFALQYGYPGVFLVSVLGSSVPFLPLPYLVVVVILSNTLNPLWIGVLAGVGGALGKVTSYLLGRSGYLLTGESSKKNLDVLQGFVSKYGPIGVFIFAVTPLPDDLYIVPMGIMRLPFWQFFIANLAGKVTLGVLVAYLSRTYFSFLLGGESLPVLVGEIAATILLSVILLKADWVLALTRLREGGIRGLVRSLPVVLRIRKN